MNDSSVKFSNCFLTEDDLPKVLKRNRSFEYLHKFKFSSCLKICNDDDDSSSSTSSANNEQLKEDY